MSKLYIVHYTFDVDRMVADEEDYLFLANRLHKFIATLPDDVLRIETNIGKIKPWVEEKAPLQEFRLVFTNVYDLRAGLALLEGFTILYKIDDNDIPIIETIEMEKLSR